MMDGVTAKRIAFRCDASAVFGGGHAMRCLTLADAMAAKGAKIIFVTAVMPSTMVQRITEAGHKIAYIEASPELDRCGANWEAQPLSHEAQAADVKATGDVIGHSDWVVVDHYLLDAQWHSAARAFAEQVLVIDDLANRSYDCDILLDQTFGRTEEEYRTLVPSNSKVLAGASFALLRPEFARERGASLERRRVGGPVRRVFISMGTADPDGVTVRILDAILADDPEYVVDVVLGPQAASLDEVNAIAAQNPKVCVHVNSTRMAELARDADIAIGAAGTTSWERCCLGLPTITLMMAENQRTVAVNLEQAGAIMMTEISDAIPALFKRLLRDEWSRFSMTAAASAIVDGLGSQRVYKKMFESVAVDTEQILLRSAGILDAEILWLWRNDPVMREMAKSHAPVTWVDHATWYSGVMNSDCTTLYIAELLGEAAAMVRFDLANDKALVSINVAPAERGQGVGGKALVLACERYQKCHQGVTLTAEIRHSNVASRSAFISAGFRQARVNDDGIHTFVKTDVQTPNESASG